jgi:predicted ABC-type ATPase
MTTNNTIKTAILTMGLPGAGKSYVLKNNYNLAEYVQIDPDLIKTEKSDYNPKKPEVYHEWSKKEAKIRTAKAIYNEQNLIIDGTGTNVEKMYKQIRELQSEGYIVELLYVSVSLETSLFRNAKRERNVPENIIFEKFETITYAYEILSKVANIARIINND